MGRIGSLRAIAIAFVLALTASVQANARLISEKSEMAMGRDAARQIEAQYPVNHDPALNELVTRMGARLASVSSRPNLPWTFRILDVSQINAFSVPGYVFVNRGLLDFVGGDGDQLAAVIGHEVGHTAAHHAVEQAEKSMVGSAIVSLIFRKQADIASLFANLALLGYSRKDEYEADKLGIQYSSKAGYDPNGMVRFLERLQAKEGKGPSGPATYFETHPATDDRVARARHEIARLH